MLWNVTYILKSLEHHKNELMPDYWLVSQGLCRKTKKCSFNMRAYRTCTSVAGIITVPTGVFSEMNFSEDVYAKDSKDTFARRLTRPYPPYVVVGWSQGRELHVQRRTENRIKEWRFYFPWRQSAESWWRRVFSTRVVLLSSRWQH